MSNEGQSFCVVARSLKEDGADGPAVPSMCESSSSAQRASYSVTITSLSIVDSRIRFV